MDNLQPHFQVSVLLIGILSALYFNLADAQSGACLGTIANNLPPIPQIINAYKSNNIRRIRIFNPNTDILEALRGSGMEVTVGVPNEDIETFAWDAGAAESWVQNYIVRYANNVNFRYIGVGNEVEPLSLLAESIVPAMHNINAALWAAGLGNVKVSTVLSAVVLGNSYPPSAGAFNQEMMPFLNPLIQFLVNNGSPFLVNLYPYFAYISEPVHIRLDFALFTAPGVIVQDGPYGYTNLFDAIVDSVYAALEKAGGANLAIVVTETGWPSAGGTATSIENARLYNSNLLRHVPVGTPRRAGVPLETYIFDVIDENMKYPALEQNWGLFYANLRPKYPFSFP